MLRHLRWFLGTQRKPAYFVYDSAFGNNDGVAMLKPLGLPLLSQLRGEAALWFHYEGTDQGRGAPRKYSHRVDYANLANRFLRHSEGIQGMVTDSYHMKARYQHFALPLNVVIIRKTNLKTGKTAQIIRFSTDLELAWDKLMAYYRLRFQLEFNCRDAKQYGGREDFMTIDPTPVYNAANLARFMVNWSWVLRQQAPFLPRSVLDLKAGFKADKYVRGVLKQLPQFAAHICIARIITDLAQWGRVNEPVEVW